MSESDWTALIGVYAVVGLGIAGVWLWRDLSEKKPPFGVDFSLSGPRWSHMSVVVLWFIAFAIMWPLFILELVRESVVAWDKKRAEKKEDGNG